MPRARERMPHALPARRMQVATPLTHERFLRRSRGSYGPAIKAGEGLFPGGCMRRWHTLLSRIESRKQLRHRVRLPP
jgi:hypothetical protein